MCCDQANPGQCFAVAVRQEVCGSVSPETAGDYSTWARSRTHRLTTDARPQRQATGYADCHGNEALKGRMAARIGDAAMLSAVAAQTQADQSSNGGRA